MTIFVHGILSSVNKWKMFTLGVLRFLRILTYPIFPASADPDFNVCGQKVTFLLFLHMVASLFVVIGVYAAEQARSEDSDIKNWVIVIVLIIVGFISLVVLMVRGCQSKLRIHGMTVSRLSDPSLNLRVFFLWIFGLVVIVHVLINLAIYIQCMTSYQVRNVQGMFSIFSSFTLMLFLLIQTSFITYYRNTTFVQDSIVSTATILILAANFAVWFNTLVSSINVFDMYANTTVQRYSNESYCFHTSSIQRTLGMKLSPYLLPPRLEFCILASTFIISFWRWPIERRDVYIENNINSAYEYHVTRSHYETIGPHVFAAMLGLLINTPVVITKLLIAFVFNWKYEDAVFALDLGQCISSICSIIAIYVSSYYLIRQFGNYWRPARLTTNEYILIIGSSGMMAYYMFGFLAALTKRVHMMFLLCCIISLFETFLQTYFLIKLRRYSTEGQSSVVISSAGILIMIKNLMFWFLSSYNPYAHVSIWDNTLIDRENWRYINKILGPVITFYRFFSGIISYTVYHKFKPSC